MTAKVPNPVDIRVSIRTQGPGTGDIPGLLDMLRYEGGRVVNWDHAPGGVFHVVIRVEAMRYVPDRWASFGIHPEVVTRL